MSYVFEQSVTPFPYYTRHHALRAQCHFLIGRLTILRDSGPHFSRLTLKFYRAWWLQVLLLAEDASVDSWFREIHAPRAWRVYLVVYLVVP